MREFLQNILERASVHKITSIAIPAFGTGNLNIPHILVANIMFEEIGIFSRQNPQTTLKTVQLVVFHKDQTSINVRLVQYA